MSKASLQRKILERVEKVIEDIGEIKDLIDEEGEDEELSDLTSDWYNELTRYIEEADVSIYDVVAYINTNL